MQHNSGSQRTFVTYFSLRQPRYKFNTPIGGENRFSQFETGKQIKDERSVEDSTKFLTDRIEAFLDQKKSCFENLEHLPDECTTTTRKHRKLNGCTASEDLCDAELNTSLAYTDDLSETGKQHLAMSISPITSFDMHTSKDQLDPSEAVLASSGSPFDFEPRSPSSSQRGYPNMFSELCKKMVKQEQEALKKLSTKEKAKLLTAELDALYSTSSKSSRSQRLPPQSKGKTTQSIERQQRLSMHESRYNFDDLDLNTLTSDDVESMTEAEQRRVVNAFYESNPRHRFKESYPFMVEGMFQKDHQNNDLKVYTSRLGTVKIADTRTPKDMSMDYVYFVAIRPGVFGGFWYDIHPIALTSAKFKSQYDTIINGFAILAHPIGSREQSAQEDRWICWNDSLGLMNVNKRSALFSMKKQPNWDKQLDIVTFDAKYQMGSFTVDKIVALTNQRDKRSHFPQEIFLLTDAVFKELRMSLAVFYSTAIKAEIVIARDRIGNVDENSPYELVVVPSFAKPNQIQFRALLIVQATFWTRSNHWIRDALSERTDAYRV